MTSGGIDHCFFRWSLRSFFQDPPHCLVGDLLHNLQLHQPVCQQPQTPASLPFGWFATGKRDQPGLLLSIQLAVVLSVRGTAVQGRLQTFLEVLLTHPGNGGLAHLHSICDLLVYPAWPLGALVGLEQDASRVSLRARAVPAAMSRFNSSRSVLRSMTGYFFFIMDERTHFIPEQSD